ncbi:MAG TPA: GrpB family protein [Actinomycetota bacterium]|nr:GrpB family protein [Actinomycetota bacterium]
MAPHDPQPVELVEYDPSWPKQFAEERDRIQAALGHAALVVEHIGSTAVPGLPAKPIIDIMVGVSDIERSGQAVAALIDLGYDYAPEFETDIPERRYFYRGIPHSHHVHMVARTSDFFDRHLIFRDHLRTHPEAAAEYARLKRGLAARFRNDRDAYTEGKRAFVETVVEAALRARGDRRPDR